MESKYYDYGGSVFRIDEDDEGRYNVFRLKEGEWVETEGALLVEIHYEGYRLSPKDVPHAENS